MKCPIEGSILKADKAEAHTGYGCASCKGSWLPKSYINSIQYTKEFEPQTFFNMLSNNMNETTHAKCPSNCGVLSSITEIKGISYCPSCLGVWFEASTLKDMLNNYQNKKDSLSFVDPASATLGIFDILGSLLK